MLVVVSRYRRSGRAAEPPRGGAGSPLRRARPRAGEPSGTMDDRDVDRERPASPPGGGIPPACRPAGHADRPGSRASPAERPDRGDAVTRRRAAAGRRARRGEDRAAGPRGPPLRHHPAAGQRGGGRGDAAVRGPRRPRAPAARPPRRTARDPARRAGGRARPRGRAGPEPVRGVRGDAQPVRRRRGGAPRHPRRRPALGRPVLAAGDPLRGPPPGRRTGRDRAGHLRHGPGRSARGGRAHRHPHHRDRRAVPRRLGAPAALPEPADHGEGGAAPVAPRPRTPLWPSCPGSAARPDQAAARTCRTPVDRRTRPTGRARAPSVTPAPPRVL